MVSMVYLETWRLDLWLRRWAAAGLKLRVVAQNHGWQAARSPSLWGSMRISLASNSTHGARGAVVSVSHHSLYGES